VPGSATTTPRSPGTTSHLSPLTLPVGCGGRLGSGVFGGMGSGGVGTGVGLVGIGLGIGSVGTGNGGCSGGTGTSGGTLGGLSGPILILVLVLVLILVLECVPDIKCDLVLSKAIMVNSMIRCEWHCLSTTRTINTPTPDPQY
jgi:hypothetical protein